MSSELVHWELEQKYQEICKSGSPLPRTFLASELRQLNPNMQEFSYEYTIERDLRGTNGGIVGF